eukprot:6181591-Pleurochrysis_carterae.AAC.2
MYIGLYEYEVHRPFRGPSCPSLLIRISQRGALTRYPRLTYPEGLITPASKLATPLQPAGKPCCMQKGQGHVRGSLAGET